MSEPAIEIRPEGPRRFRVDEGGGLAPVHVKLEDALSYAKWRAGFFLGREVWVRDAAGGIAQVIAAEEIERSAGYGTMR